MENETAGYTAPRLPPPPWETVAQASPPDQTSGRDFDTYDTNNDGRHREQLLCVVAQRGCVW